MSPGSKYRLCTILILTGFVLPATGSARSLQEVLNEGLIQIGVVLINPWTIRLGPGELSGFEIDVSKKLAEDMDVAVEFRVYSADRIIPALEAGEIDLIAAGLRISPKTALHVNFSQPYSTMGIMMATHRETTLLVDELDDFDDPDYRMAAIIGSEAAGLITRIFPSAVLLEFQTPELASEALLDGLVNAYLDEEPIPTYLALDNPMIVDVPLTAPLLQTRAGFAINKGDPDFLAFLNAWITARQSDTWLPTIHSYWFDSLRWRDELSRSGSN